MRRREPFRPRDLAELDARLLSRARAVVPMREAIGLRDRHTIALRHDVDRDLETAVKIAEWEHERGYRSTYFLLHTAAYWRRPDDELEDALEMIVAFGHEVGLHVDSVTVALRTGQDPWRTMERALVRLRELTPAPVVGVVGHGDPLCHEVGYVNDEIFTECARPDMGAPDRAISHNGHTVRLEPRSLCELGLDYCSSWLPRGAYLSDSGGRWAPGFSWAVKRWPPRSGPLHVLWHPCWWREAFA